MSENEFYVYGLYEEENNLPFYIGKGKGKRMYHHFYNAEDVRNPYKDRKVKRLQEQEGKSPEARIIKDDLSEKKAYDLEYLLINIHYKDLTNIKKTRGQGYWRDLDEETIKKMKEKADGRYTLDWFIDRYGEEKGRQKYEERRKRLSEDRSGEGNPFHGKTHDDETKEKISEKMKEVAENEEWRDKVSENRKGKAKGKDNPNYKHIPKDKLRDLVIKSDLNFGEIADHFDTTTQTLRRKMKDYFGMTYSEMT